MKLKLSLFSFLVALFMIVGTFCVFANPVENLELIPDKLKNAGELTYVTKGDLAYTISRILGSGELNSEADYVKYANANGYLVSDGGAEEIIDFHTFNKVCVKMIGYEELAKLYGGGENGNLKVVLDEKIYKNVDISTYDNITVAQYKQLIYNLLTAETMKYEYSYNGNGEIGHDGERKNVLTEKMNISAYKGIIKSASSSINATLILDNIYTHNPNLLTPGTQYGFYAGNCVDLYKFEYAPAEIWVDENDRILYIKPLKDVEIFYDVIYSVNNDAEENRYAIDYITKIEFLRDKKSYDVSPDCVFVYNEEETTAPTVFANKFAKVIRVDGKVTFIETWDLEEGGLITEVKNNSITYQKGQRSSILDEISVYDKMIVIIDTISTDRTQIKENSVFSYYMNKNNNSMVIVVSEKMRAGIFQSIGADTIVIDGVDYDRNSDTYFSKDGKTYHNNEYSGMFNNLVAAYTDYSDKVKYVKFVGADTTVSGIYAFVIKTRYDSFEDKTTIHCFNTNSEWNTYSFAEKARVDGRTYKTQAAIYNALIGTGIFTAGRNNGRLLTDAVNTEYAYLAVLRFDNEGKIKFVDTPYVNTNETEGNSLYPNYYRINNRAREIGVDRAEVSATGANYVFKHTWNEKYYFPKVLPAIEVPIDKVSGMVMIQDNVKSSYVAKNINGAGTIPDFEGMIFNAGEEKIPEFAVEVMGFSSTGEKIDNEVKSSIITKIIDTVNSDNELVKKISTTGSGGTKDIEVVYSVDGSGNITSNTFVNEEVDPINTGSVYTGGVRTISLGDLKKGDVIAYESLGERVIGITRRFAFYMPDGSVNTHYKLSYNNIDRYSENSPVISYGKLYLASNGSVQIYDTNINNRRIYDVSSGIIYCYDLETEEFKIVASNELKDYVGLGGETDADRVLVIGRHSRGTDVVVYRNIE